MKTLLNLDKILFSIIFSSFLILLGTSCTRQNYYYRPNDGNALALRQKKDLHFSGSVYDTDLNKPSNSGNVQVGFSPISHLGIVSSYFTVKDQHPDNDQVRGKGRYFDFAIGGYHFIPFHKKYKRRGKRISYSPYRFKQNRALWIDEGVLFDLYLGAGKGKTQSFYLEGGRSNFNFNKRTLQLGVHLIKRRSGLSFTFRYGLLNYTKGYIGGKISSRERLQLKALKTYQNFNLRETTFHGFVGIRHAQVFATLTILTGEKQLDAMGVVDGNFNFGVLAELDEWFSFDRNIKKKKSKKSKKKKRRKRKRRRR